MSKAFPHFKLDKFDDGCLYWFGELAPGIYETMFNERLTYTVMAVYNNTHPQQMMSSSIRVYPVLPDYNYLCNKWDYRMILRLEKNPYTLDSQANKDLNGAIFIATFINKGNNAHCNAVKELRMFECWLQISECFYAMKMKYPLFVWSWDKMIVEFPFLDQYVKERIYGTI